MSLWSKIRGTIETVFQIGIGGPQIKANGGAVEHRNAADTAFAITRGLDPVAANDLVTKSYGDANYGSSGVKTIRFVIGTATVSSATQIPANAIVQNCEVKITTPYSAGGTIAVGQTGTVALLQATTDNLPQSTDMFEVEQDTAWGAAPLAVLVTVGGAPAAGAGVVIVRYATPAA